MMLPLYFSIFWIVGIVWVNHKIVMLAYDMDIKKQQNLNLIYL